MNKEEIFNHFSTILDNIIEENPVAKYYFIEPKFMYEGYNFGNGISYCCGATRGCFIDESFPYVVKFNLYEYEELDNEYTDACQRELDYYNLAKRANFSKYLLEPVYLGEYTKEVYCCRNYSIPECFDEDISYVEEGNSREEILISIPLFAYLKVEFKPIIIDSTSKEYRYAVKSKSPLRGRNIDVAAFFIRNYGEDEYNEFSNFLRCCSINDLHCGNCAFVEGKIVLIDYAGYHG